MNRVPVPGLVGVVSRGAVGYTDGAARNVDGIDMSVKTAMRAASRVVTPTSSMSCLVLFIFDQLFLRY
ncbi:MAG: hypothetical protein ACJ0H0_07790 [Vicinamibacterales bacterium]